MKNFDLNTTIMKLVTDETTTNWTIRNAVEGVQIFGGIGSGKTTGSGQLLAIKYLLAGFGGLVLTVKPDEKQMWEAYCEIAGRKDDLIIVEPGSEHFFNFLDYVSQGDGMTENIVQVLKTVIRASEGKVSTGSNDAFWDTALDMLIFNVIDICKLAYGSVTVQRMYDIVQTMPKSDAEKKDKKETAYKKAFALATENVDRQIEEWKLAQPTDILRQFKTESDFDNAVCEAIADARTLKFVDQFFGERLDGLHEKTRSIIDFSFSGFLFYLLRDPVYSLFCRRASTFTPEDCLEGKIILLNLPVKLFHKVGRDCQILFKYIWQRSMEKRNVKENNRPVFLWSDEAQNFLHEHDVDCQTTARSSLIATVYISQNLPNYYARMEAAKSDSLIDSFMGTLATKIFHANADIKTNEYASELIGNIGYEDISRTAGEQSSTRTKSLTIDLAVRPEAFVKLRTGARINDFIVEGYLHIQGNPLANELNYIKVFFNQNYINNL